MERRSAARRSSAPRNRMPMAPVEEKQQQQRRRLGTGLRRMPSAVSPAAPQGCFSAELVMVFLWVTASLVLLPLVLPPLPPPPFLLLVVPVCLLAVLVALAFVPLDAHSNIVGSSCLQ